MNDIACLLVGPPPSSGRARRSAFRDALRDEVVKRSLVALLGLAILGALPGTAHALEPFASLVPNPATAMNSEGRVRPCINCHNNPDGGAGCGTPPCLNPFGMAFRANAYTWDAALAMLDSDGDGFTNGQELQDPFGLWREGPMPGVPSLATAPGNPGVTPGDTDDDGDGYCAFGIDENDDGDCLDSGENDGSFDCNDASTSVHSHASEVCSNVGDDDCDGFPTLTDSECIDVVDRDGDGRCPMGRDMNGDRNCAGPSEMSATIVDCDDGRANVYTGASENCSDTVDNDCDGDIDLADGQCQGDTDGDGDGYCPVGIDLDDDGDCTGPGEIVTTTGDCDDTNAAVNPTAVENSAALCGDGTDNECNGAADLNDPACATYLDQDFDGYCTVGRDVDGDGDCTGATDSAEGGDCDDVNATRSPGLVENCTDPDDVDEDCDGESNLDDVGDDGRADSTCLGYLDIDGDGYCFVGPDRNLDGRCTGLTEFGFATDCDETSGLAFFVNPTRPEICTDAADNDCDGSTDARDPNCIDYLDTDRDGWCAVGEDGNRDGDCADAGEQGADVDLAPNDPTVHPGAHENCLDDRDNDQDGTTDEADADCTTGVDADGDGYCPLGRDDDGDGNCTDEGEADVIASDCDDTDAETVPGSTEVECLDARDDDCDTDVDLFDRDCFRLFDADGDGFCGTGVDDNGDGDCLDEAEDRFGVDCDDHDDAINPDAAEVCDNLDDGVPVDDDCDGRANVLDSQCACMSDGDCDDGDACTVDRCAGPLVGCRYVRAAACIDGGVPPDAGGADAGGLPASSGCAAAPGRGGALWTFSGVLALALMLRRMRSRVALAAAAMALTLMASAPTAYAYPAYATAGTSRAPNAVTMGCLTCHNNTGGGGGCASPPCFNLFGSAFNSNGETWNAALAALDSDGDGWTNGEELLDPGGAWPDGGADPAPTAQARLPGFTTAWCGTYSRACSLNECTLFYDDCDTSPAAACIEQNPYFSCSCPTGYGGTGHGSGGCNNINECSPGNPCLEDTVAGNACIDATPRYNCSCGPGYQVANDGTYSETCTNVNECATGNPCLEDTVGGNSCVDTVGRFDCTCSAAAGYQVVNNGGYPESCGDINECTSGNPCNEDSGTGNACVNATPRYNCTCTTGWVLQNDGSFMETCTNVNECATPGICGVGSCFDNPGSYSCACPSGYTFNGTTCADINECSPAGVCGVGSCTNSPGSYSCTCPGGYTFNGVTCEVNNACNAGTDNCADAEGAICTAMGSMSWTCACPSGYVGNGIARSSGGTGCTNVNECMVTSGICGVGTCTDVPGTYTCSCPTGYSFNGTTCVDVNECTGTPGICGPGTCMNTTGSYRCTCNAGYTGPPSGGTCGDINECATAATCNAASGWGSCTNTVGGFTCACAIGYQGSGSGLSRTCVNTDECTASPPCGVGTCTDTIGSYRCACPSGYTGAPTGGTCDDVDECTDATRCGGTMGFGSCVNEPGTFSCACNVGFEVTGSGASRTCINVDECTRSLDDCDTNATCADSVPAFGAPRFVCTCIDGWQGPGTFCEDFDECSDPAENDCSPLGHCVNEVGTYGCECNDGYTGNGFECADANECSLAECGENEVCINQLGVLPEDALCECEPGTVRGPDSTCGSACGNGQRVIGEECDDGNMVDGDGCTNECLVGEGFACTETDGLSHCTPGCGDSLIDVPAGEECDDGPDNDDTVPGACRTNCRAASCGDTVVDEGEECDLGEVANASRTSNGCRVDCRMAFCGDGVLDDGEYCDDGVIDPDAGTHVPQPAESCTIACLGDVGGPADAGTPGAEPAVVGSAGCGCTVAGGRGPTLSLIGLLGGLALMAGRRRR